MGVWPKVIGVAVSLKMVGAKFRSLRVFEDCLKSRVPDFI